jgi:hypothetical protein
MQQNKTVKSSQNKEISITKIEIDIRSVSFYSLISIITRIWNSQIKFKPKKRLLFNIILSS